MPRNVPSTSSPQVLQTVSWVIKHGLKPVALTPKTKAAIAKDYVEPDYIPPTLEFWENNDYGVGVVTGKDVMDVDLDCNEAIYFGSQFLPPTKAIFGRASKRRSHYLYKAIVGDTPIPNTEQHIDMVGGVDSCTTICELRGLRSQTVLPGSVHPDSGEMIEWEDVPFPPVPEVPLSELQDAVRNIAICTLIARHLWMEGQRHEMLKHLSGMFHGLDWPLEEAETIIRAVMDYSKDDDKTRITTLRGTYEKADRGEPVTGAPRLREVCGDWMLVDLLLRLCGSPVASMVHIWNASYATILVEGKFRIVRTDVSPGEMPIFFQKDDFVNQLQHEIIRSPDDPYKRLPKTRVWLASPKRRMYETMDFMPGVTEPPAGVLNLWTGWAVEPKKAGSCDAWLELLHEVICGGDDEMNRWMLHWFANIIREPMEKSMTAPVIVGTQGAGKTTLVDYFGRILGKASYTMATDAEHIRGRFNKHQAMTLLLHSEEALFAGDDSHRSIIKSLITDRYRLIEAKGIDAKQISSHLRLILTSNHARAAAVEPGDRRHTVIDMEQRRASPKLLGHVFDEIRGSGPAVLFGHLLDMDYDPAVPRDNVRNEALRTMQSLTLKPDEAWWLECLQRGKMLPNYLQHLSRPHHEDWPSQFVSSALHSAMSQTLRERNVRYVPGLQEFCTKLSNMLPGHDIAGRKRQKMYSTGETMDDGHKVSMPPAIRNYIECLGSRPQSYCGFPSLEECRTAFNQWARMDYEWPEEDEGDDDPDSEPEFMREHRNDF